MKVVVANRTECPLLAISGHSSLCGFMSAIGGKADIKWRREKSPLLTQSGHPARAKARLSNPIRPMLVVACTPGADHTENHEPSGVHKRRP
jgi:hypothetical protein